jgi:hypothetical protein
MGGFKISGVGREMGEYALRHYTEPKSIWIKYVHIPEAWTFQLLTTNIVQRRESQGIPYSYRYIVLNKFRSSCRCLLSLYHLLISPSRPLDMSLAWPCHIFRFCLSSDQDDAGPILPYLIHMPCYYGSYQSGFTIGRMLHCRGLRERRVIYIVCMELAQPPIILRPK